MSERQEKAKRRLVFPTPTRESIQTDIERYEKEETETSRLLAQAQAQVLLHQTNLQRQSGALAALRAMTEPHYEEEGEDAAKKSPKGQQPANAP